MYTTIICLNMWRINGFPPCYRSWWCHDVITLMTPLMFLDHRANLHTKYIIHEHVRNVCVYQLYLYFCCNIKDTLSTHLLFVTQCNAIFCIPGTYIFLYSLNSVSFPIYHCPVMHELETICILKQSVNYFPSRKEISHTFHITKFSQMVGIFLQICKIDWFHNIIVSTQ